MNLPSLDEFRRLYGSIGGAGDAIQAGTQGAEKGLDLASSIKARQDLVEAKKSALQNAIAALGIKKDKTTADVGLENAKTEAIKTGKGNFTTVGQTADGKLIEQDKNTGEYKVSDTKAAPGLGKGFTAMADVRAKTALSRELLDDPNYKQNQQILDRGLRIENISNAKDAIDNPAKLHILNDLIVAQAEGGKASLAGVQKVANETAQQFAARVLEKITNEPQSAQADQFINQLKSISRADMKSAYTSIDALAQAKGNALKSQFPGYEAGIDKTSKNFAKDYTTGLYGGKFPDFLSEGGAQGQINKPDAAPVDPQVQKFMDLLKG